MAFLFVKQLGNLHQEIKIERKKEKRSASAKKVECVKSLLVRRLRRAYESRKKRMRVERSV